MQLAYNVNVPAENYVQMIETLSHKLSACCLYGILQCVWGSVSVQWWIYTMCGYQICLKAETHFIKRDSLLQILIFM